MGENVGVFVCILARAARINNLHIHIADLHVIEKKGREIPQSGLGNLNFDLIIICLCVSKKPPPQKINCQLQSFHFLDFDHKSKKNRPVA